MTSSTPSTSGRTGTQASQYVKDGMAQLLAIGANDPDNQATQDYITAAQLDSATTSVNIKVFAMSRSVSVLEASSGHRGALLGGHFGGQDVVDRSM